MYENANIPLIELLDDCFTDQAWHADDGNNVGSLDNLKKSFDSLEKHCSSFAYHLLEKAKPIIFNGKVEIVDGCSIFCSVIGSNNSVRSFRKINKTAEIVVKKAGRSGQCFTSKCL